MAFLKIRNFYGQNLTYTIKKKIDAKLIFLKNIKSDFTLLAKISLNYLPPHFEN